MYISRMKTQIMSFTSDIHKRSRSGYSLALRAKQFHILILFSSALKEIHAVFGKTPGWCLVWSNFVQLLGCFHCPHQFSRQARQASQQQVNYEQFTNHFPSNTCQFEIRVRPRKPTNVQNIPCLFWHMYQVFNCTTGLHKVSILT